MYVYRDEKGIKSEVLRWGVQENFSDLMPITRAFLGSRVFRILYQRLIYLSIGELSYPVLKEGLALYGCWAA